MIPDSPEFSATVALFAAFVSAISALIALASVVMTRKNWRDSNRPVVSAYVDEESGGGGITVFNLYLKNTGTRPATEIQLHASEKDIEWIVAEQAEPKRRQHIKTVFSQKSRLAILHPEETLVTSFGLASACPDEHWLKYGEELPVRVTYRDLEGRKFSSKLLIRVRPREGFGGGVWKNAA
ncbi:hypothetical protein [Azospira oryzae]|uniref:hypothetical protein n=1 Tax=Azospira oryzae TaxID=146939 RepID=UPI001962B6D8|nr:hypothetical protein [Azospira oryzae]